MSGRPRQLFSPERRLPTGTDYPNQAVQNTLQTVRLRCLKASRDGLFLATGMSHDDDSAIHKKQTIVTHTIFKNDL